jgi:hypothetical protein
MHCVRPPPYCCHCSRDKKGPRGSGTRCSGMSPEIQSQRRAATSPSTPYFLKVGEVVRIAGRLKLFLNRVAALRGSGGCRYSKALKNRTDSAIIAFRTVVCIRFSSAKFRARTSLRCRVLSFDKLTALYLAFNLFASRVKVIMSDSKYRSTIT